MNEHSNITECHEQYFRKQTNCEKNNYHKLLPAECKDI